ncbi:hypothetical protein HPB51_020133 [Rhipicephalus microplus]|uniref:Uncharacterized protein n=1 Tax=Rhipicephalus microplus TaxID=6941 RepID=A0A9J6EJ26_RHIMP|nr:hypothetical protein HPB51_020133 [Rhipicephalus microplus]
MAQSRTTDPDIPASTTLRSGRVLSNSPPITDGVQASTAAPHHDCSEAISRGFSLFAQELKTSGFGCASFGSFNENEIPYFHGFKDDPTNWYLLDMADASVGLLMVKSSSLVRCSSGVRVYTHFSGRPTCLKRGMVYGNPVRLPRTTFPCPVLPAWDRAAKHFPSDEARPCTWTEALGVTSVPDCSSHLFRGHRLYTLVDNPVFE